MTKKLKNLIDQLSESEKKVLYEHIKNQYAVEERVSMLRDDIKDKVIELLKVEFIHVEGVCERASFHSLSLESMDVMAFSETLVQEFNLEAISLSQVMQWQTVKDIVSYLDNTMEVVSDGDNTEEDW